MKNNSYVGFFSNFTNGTKLKIIASLAGGPLTVGEIARINGIEQSNVSHNLSSLLECQIVSCEKDGKRRLYSLNKKTVYPLLKIAKKHVRCNCSLDCGRDCS